MLAIDFGFVTTPSMHVLDLDCSKFIIRKMYVCNEFVHTSLYMGHIPVLMAAQKNGQIFEQVILEWYVGSVDCIMCCTTVHNYS